MFAHRLTTRHGRYYRELGEINKAWRVRCETAPEASLCFTDSAACHREAGGSGRQYGSRRVFYIHVDKVTPAHLRVMAAALGESPPRAARR